MGKCLPSMPCYDNNVIVYTTYPAGCSTTTPSAFTLPLASDDLYYSGPALIYSGIDTTDTLTVALQKINFFLASAQECHCTWGDLTGDLADQTDLIEYLSLTYYPNSNPESYIGLTSLNAGAGLSYDNTTGTFVNTEPDQIVTLTEGANTTITGTYPDFTIASSGGSTSPGGSNQQVQYNNSGAFGGSSSFTWDNPNKTLIASSQGVSIGGYGLIVNTINASYQLYNDLTNGYTSGMWASAGKLYLGGRSVTNINGDLEINTETITFNNGIALKENTPIQLVANTDNYSLSRQSFIRLNSSVPVNITGIVAVTNKVIVFRNIGANTITFTNEDANSTAGNRLTTSTGASIALATNQSLTLLYDSVSQRWFDIAYR